MARLIIDIGDMERIIDWLVDTYGDDIEEDMRNHTKNPWWTDPSAVFDTYLDEEWGYMRVDFSYLEPDAQEELKQRIESLKKELEEKNFIDTNKALKVVRTLIQFDDRSKELQKWFNDFCEKDKINIYELVDAVGLWIRQFE